MYSIFGCVFQFLRYLLTCECALHLTWLEPTGKVSPQWLPNPRILEYFNYRNVVCVCVCEYICICMYICMYIHILSIRFGQNQSKSDKVAILALVSKEKQASTLL